MDSRVLTRIAMVATLAGIALQIPMRLFPEFYGYLLARAGLRSLPETAAVAILIGGITAMGFVVWLLGIWIIPKGPVPAAFLAVLAALTAMLFFAAAVVVAVGSR